MASTSQRYGKAGGGGQQRGANDDDCDWSDAQPNPRYDVPCGRPAGLSDDSDDSDYDDDDIFYSDTLKSQPPAAGNRGQINAIPNRPEVMEPVERLRLACMNDEIDKVLELLDGGVRADECSQATGWSPLMIAASYGNVELMTLLIDRGADVNFRATGSGEELTPLMVSSLARTSADDLMRCAGLLIERDANVNLANVHGLTPLMFAAKENKLKLVEALVAAGADVNAVDQHGRSVLQVAAAQGFGKIVRFLLEHGSDASFINEFGQTAAEVAMAKGHDVLSDILYRVCTTKWTPGSHPDLMNELVDIKAKIPDKADEMMECKERSQIEMVLENLHLQNTFKKFEEHNISYLHFLNMGESQLKDIGIGIVGDRMKILDAIRDIHNREWVDQSLTPIYLKSDITASEVVCILNNAKKHMEYISATVKYLRKKAMSNPGMMEAGAEQNPLKDMIEYTNSSLKATCRLQTEVKYLERVLRQLEKDAEFQIPDTIDGRGGRVLASKWTTMLAVVSLAGIGCIFAGRFRSPGSMQ